MQQIQSLYRFILHSFEVMLRPAQDRGLRSATVDGTPHKLALHLVHHQSGKKFPTPQASKVLITPMGPL